MSYLTDRKRATGKGASGHGTIHHWHMIVSAVALVGLIFFFVFTLGQAIGMPYEEARAYYARPFPAIIALLTVVTALYHFKGGVQVAIEDYFRHGTKKVLLIASILFSYFLMGVAVFSIIRIAL